jgi:hypothetical protein
MDNGERVRGLFQSTLRDIHLQELKKNHEKAQSCNWCSDRDRVELSFSGI